MGEEDVARQAPNVLRMRMLGASVVPVKSGSRTLKDAMNEALRDWVTNVRTTHYCVGSAAGPHPYPTLVADLQRVIGDEARLQWAERFGGLPDSVVACVGGGSNAIGIFRAFMDDDVALFGVEAAGSGLQTDRHAATLTQGKTGVLHGAKTLVLSDADGQILEAHSISAGLDYPGVGPEHAALKASGRAHYLAVDDGGGADGGAPSCAHRRDLDRLGNGPCIRCACRNRSNRSAAPGSTREDLGLLVGSRRQGSRDADGANDVTLARIDDCMVACKAAGRPALVIYLTIGDPSVADSLACARAALDAGADILELGVPFSDPSADGPTIADRKSPRHRRRRQPASGSRCGPTTAPKALRLRWCCSPT